MIDYKQSGVDLKKASELNEIIKNTIDKGQSSFCALFEHQYLNEYALAACCDGIGTKIIPLLEKQDTKTMAQDLVAMNLNDLICCGAFPLFFLDYIAIHAINVVLLEAFMKHLSSTLNTYDCSLLGGETSELNDLLYNNSLDAAGFCVGMVKKENIIGKDKVKKGDIIIGLTSSGPHSNGFSLIRKLHKERLLSDKMFDIALKPTKIYVKEVLELTKNNLINAAANITGGGLVDNLNRAIPGGLNAKLNFNAIPKQEFFEELKKITNKEECYKVFNMGVGFCIICNKSNVNTVLETCKSYEPFILGEVIGN